ncbi:Manganese/iron superoxide dismutase [Staphylotrichum tortipilum]|uniref:Manganese/iron superoxide dismutase n=1 Tax=Staphylotrichum tortipilum TaxID=2831512 RepID=A0AAN6MPS5_9PEZI|nr:Manganese/iron superoxide dismutase [Staphylotrichum longicolle]
MLRPRLIRAPLRPRLNSTPAQSPLLSLACQKRSKHTVPPLDYNLHNECATKGIGTFLSANAFNISWAQYQTHVLQRLNALTYETEWALKQPKDILLGTARSAEDASVFNYASMAHNNHFFFKHLSPTSVEIPENLRANLEQSFGTMETLRKEMTITAASMFGPGFVWLVKTSHPGLAVGFKVLATYGAGSPYPGAHWRQQGTDMNTAAGTRTHDGIAAGKDYLAHSAYGAGKLDNGIAAKVAYAPGGTDLQPVLCLNTWEHVWLWDYGFGVGHDGGGKLAYAEKWWEMINWELVHKEANIQRRDMVAGGGTAPAATAAA